MSDVARIRLYFGICLTLLIIAAIAPLASVWWFDVFKPADESLGDWFSRSGAITTIFSLLVTSVSSEALRGLVIPGTMPDLDKIGLYNEFEPRFSWCEKLALVMTILGTFVWGYGSMML